MLLFISFPALLLPTRFWPTVARGIAGLSILLRPGKARGEIKRIEQLLPKGIPQRHNAKSLLSVVTARYIERSMIYVRLAWRPHWRPRATIGGLDDVAAAMEKGGVVLWAVNQIASLIVLRLLLHDAGYRLNHVRSWNHGISRTRYGRRVLNAFFWNIEDRYADHVVLPFRGPFGALRQVNRILRDGGLVSFRAVANSEAPVSLPLLGGCMQVALGAPRAALKSQAALFTVHCRYDGQEIRHYSLTPIDISQGIETATREFGAICKQAMEDNPDLWPVNNPQFVPDETEKHSF